jgi:hypothetical protein
MKISDLRTQLFILEGSPVFLAARLLKIDRSVALKQSKITRKAIIGP